MKRQIEAITQLFGELLSVSIKETFVKLECTVRINLQRTPNEDTFQNLLPMVSDRDMWRMQMTTEADDDLFDLRIGSNIADACNESKLQPYYADEITLTYIIDKTKVNDTITVYDYDILLDFINDLSVTATFNAIQNNIGEKLIIEIWSEHYTRFNTSSIAFVRKDDLLPDLSLNTNRQKRKEKCEELCQWNNLFTNLTPEDLHVISMETESELSKYFDQLCILLSACYIADFSSIDRTGVTLRLSGYKMMMMESQIVKTNGLCFNQESANLWYRIYDWCYTGGYTSDRLCIARNIISLNITSIHELRLNASTLDAIKSNFKIFEKDNVRQYIKVRNDISQTLLDMQGKVNSIVEGFTSDFHKSVISLGTFFLTVVVVRVISKGDISGAFTGSIVLLSFAFIALSAVNLIYSRKILERKERLFTKHYKQLKDRYNQLLSEEESQQIFEDCNPKIDGTHANFIQWQKNRYTWIWVLSLILFSLLLIGMWFYNLLETSNLAKVIKILVECYTKNI